MQGDKVKYILLSYPLIILIVFFLIPLGILVVSSFYLHTPREYLKPGFTLEHYIRFFTTPFYLEKMWFTVKISLVVALICLFLGYPVAYYLARMRSGKLRNIYMITIIGTLWLTYIIRAYAWRIILAGVGPINKILTTVGILSEPISFAPGYGAVIVGLIYVFLPFMILTLYSSINNIDINLEEASLSLGANRLKTFLKVTLPLSRNGIISGVLLVFVLALGVYVTASILGNPSEWTLAIFIGDTITELLNIPFAAAMSMVLIALVIGSLGLLAMLTKAKQKGVS